MLEILCLLEVIILWMVVRQELRDRERSRVEWHALELSSGVVRVINEGTDRAVQVSIEAWDDERILRRWLPRLEGGESWDVEFPGAGPELVPGPHPLGDVSSDAPREPVRWSTRPGASAPHGGLCQVSSRPAEHSPLASRTTVAPSEGSQYSVRITWRTPRGRWSSQRVPVSVRAMTAAASTAPGITALRPVDGIASTPRRARPRAAHDRRA